MAWNGNNNRGRPFIEVNFGRPNPPPPVVEVDIMRPGGYSGGGYSRPMVEVDIFGSSRGPPQPPRPVIEVDIMNRPQYPGYPAAPPKVVVSTGGQNGAPYGQQNGAYPGYGFNNGGYGRNPYANNYPPGNYNNSGW